MRQTPLKTWLFLLFLCVLQTLILSCSTVAITGRKQLSLVPDSTLNAMSVEQYDKFLSEHEVSDDIGQTQMVKRVGRRIQRAVEQRFAEENRSQELEWYEWSFNLIEDRSANAWCMPGGRVVVYTGILPVTKDETGLAVVMGHEIAHAIANHGREKISQALVKEFGVIALSEALAEKPAQTRNIFLNAYGVGTEVGVMLPYSRTIESEADRIGLVLMAMAGYDPRAAIDFWQRMAELNRGRTPPEFLSTHPPYEKRIENIRKFLPEALEYYKGR